MPEPPTEPENRSASSKRPFFILALIATATLGYLLYDWQSALPPEAVKQATFVGRQSCVKCHQQEAKLYHGSHHDRAMELANEETILGDFDDAEFNWLGVTTRMFRRDGKYFMNAEGPDGEMHDYEVEWTFGIDPLQQYMTKFPDGRVQVLPASWDVHKKEWFAVTPPDVPDTRIQHDDPLHWTGIAQNWNTMCADCHSTNLQKNYDLASDSYHTEYSEIDVSCEACHGPGSVHVELAESQGIFWDRRHGYGLSNELKKVSNTKQIETCAPCHSRRSAIHPDYHAGEDWFDHYQPSLLDEGLYHANGHIQDEVYVYGSFLQSKMYHKDVRCTDCHNPHSLELKYEGNQLCNQCHQPGKYNVLSHHHHPEATTNEPGAIEGSGTLCISCHMSVRTYMNIDDRHDHSFRVPRPDLTVELGTPNACNDCHTEPEEDAQWAADWVRKWYGEKRPPQMAGNELATRAIHAGRTLKPEGEELLLEVADDKNAADITRATALQLLAGYPTRQSREARRQALYDRSELVRIATTRAVDQTDQQSLLNSLKRQLEDPAKAVRIEAANRLVAFLGTPLGGPDDASLRENLEKAIEEFRDSQKFNLDRVEGHLSLGQLEARLGDFKQAIKHLRDAVRIAPYRTDPRSMLIELLVATGGDEQEIRQLREQEADLLLRDQSLLPTADAPHYRRGMLLYQLGRIDEASEELAAAARLGPDNYQNWLAVTLIYEKQQRWRDALKSLQEMQRLRPNSDDVKGLYLKLRQQIESAEQANSEEAVTEEPES